MNRIKRNNKNGFTLIELIVVMAVLAILALLAAPKFLGQTKEAQFTKHINNAKVLEDAAERYYIDNGKWPRADVAPYSNEEVASYAERIYDLAGEEMVLEEGNYWDLDYEALAIYAKLPDQNEKDNYILRNPVGAVYYLDDLTEEGAERVPVDAIEEGREPEHVAAQTWNFAYTGGAQEITLTKGRYQLEVWGAQGGTGNYEGGKGGYTSGVIQLMMDDTFWVSIGGQGVSTNGHTKALGGWNGGGYGNTNTTFSQSKGLYRGSGGGSTDIRLSGGLWDNQQGLLSRIVVAGGGGGTGGADGNYVGDVLRDWGSIGGAGGGNIGGDGGFPTELISSSVRLGGFGGTAEKGGGAGTFTLSASNIYNEKGTATDGAFGIGGNSGVFSLNYYIGGAGGGGWYGGGGGAPGGPGGGGGSGYVLTQDSHKPTGYTPSSDYHMTDAQLIAGNETMPNPQGGTMVGNSGNGYARITKLEVKK